MNQQQPMKTRILKIIFSVLSTYILLAGGYYFYDGYFRTAFSNDQCLWVVETADSTQHIAIRQILEGGVSDRAGLKDGDILVAVNDSLVGANTGLAQRLINSFSTDEVFYYTVRRGNDLLRLPIQIIKTRNTLYFSLAMLGFGFLFIGWIVGAAKPTDLIPRLFYITSMSGALTFLVFGVVIGPGYQGNLVWAIHAITPFAIFAPSFVHFFLWFPTEKLTRKTRRWLVPGIYVSFVGFVAFDMLVKNRGNISFFLMFLLMGISFGMFFHSYRNIKEESKRKPLRSILVGTILGILGFVYMIIIPAFVPVAFINHPETLAGVAVVIAIPLSFGYSILRYRTMDIELIIKKSLVYAVTTASLAAIYLSILFAGGYIIQSWFGGPANNPVFHFGVLLLAAFIFAPVKDRVQELVDRRFFRERFDYQKTLLGFSEDLPRLTELDQILQKVMHTVTDTMHIESIAIVLFSEGRETPTNYVQKGIQSGRCDFSLTDVLISRLAAARHALRLDHAHIPELELPPIELNRIEECGMELAVPLIKQDQMTGVLLLGAKSSEKPFSGEDLDLLTTVANQACVAIDNARLMRRELEKARFENELNVARRIQQSLLPQKSPDIAGVDMDGVSIPAMSVGGDYFDYIQLDDHRVLIAIGDVSGKGVSAALYMSKIQGMIQVASHLFVSPRKILIEVNEWMCHDMEKKSFVTIILALLDTKAGTITMCRAGHNPAITFHDGRLKIIQCKGLGVGLVSGEKFEENLEEETEQLEDDKLLVLYTDGVTEAMNDQQEEFGEDRLFDLIQSRTDLPAKAIVHAIVEEVQKFCGPVEQHDDMTLVVARVRQT
ncbi:MAG: SpoIIE family protein phosphatase [Bacteroidetes bacterium]|nr:SpoIIE family protein phosphatase [Bacteroidota bacterium]